MHLDVSFLDEGKGQINGNGKREWGQKDLEETKTDGGREAECQTDHRR